MPSAPPTPPHSTPPSTPALRLTLPARPEHLEPLVALGLAVAQAGGLDPQQALDLERALRLAGGAALGQAAQSAEHQELELVLEPSPGELAVRLRDQGPPLHWAEREGDLAGLTGLLEEVSWRNLGPRGNELCLVKRWPTTAGPGAEAWPAGPEASGAGMEEWTPASGDPRVELLAPGQAVAVARCAWSTYGYTYVDPDLYYPERLEELNRGGRLISAVATDGQGRVLGHASLALAPGRTGRAELGKAFVEPRQRGRGLMGAMCRFLLDLAPQRGLTTLVSQAVTGHTVSQRVSQGLGFVDCALRLAAAPQVLFRELPAESQRLSLLVNARLTPPLPLRPPLPNRHAALLGRIYDALGYATGQAETPVDLAPAGCGVLEVRRAPRWQGAEIEVRELGAGSGRELERLWRGLRLERLEVILLSLPLGRPGLPELLAQAEDLGFFFCGVEPDPQGDRLLLQYLNNLALDYEQIQVLGPLGREIKDYVRRQDPNQAAGPDPACAI